MTKRQFIRLSLLPALIILVLLSIYPLIEVIRLSFLDKVLIKPDSGQFTGISNYIRLFGDRRFWNALKVTMMWQLITVTGSLSLGIIVSMLLYRNISPVLKSFLTLAFIFPAILPRVAAAYTWRFMYSPLLGVFNFFLLKMGLPRIEFLTDSKIALFSVAAIDIWQWGLLLSVIILGVLESIPEEPIEAAQIDGVNGLQLHMHITFPLILPTIISLSFLKVIESFRSFELIYILTKGGPGIATETIDLYAFNIGLAMDGNISYGASISFIMFLVTLMIANILWGVLRHES